MLDIPEVETRQPTLFGTYLEACITARKINSNDATLGTGFFASIREEEHGFTVRMYDCETDNQVGIITSRGPEPCSLI